MKRIFLAFLFMIFLSGCTTSYRVRVNGYLDTTGPQNPIPGGSSFYVITQKNVKNPIFENEIKSKIENLLKDKGYVIRSYEKADFLLDFSYAMSAGKVVTEVTPVYHSGEVGTVRTYTSSGKSSVSYVEYPGYTTYMPHKYTVYTASLTLEIIDAGRYRNSNERKQIWIGEAANTSEDPDIREAVNYLLIADFAHFGENTHTSVTSDISENDPRVKRLLLQ